MPPLPWHEHAGAGLARGGRLVLHGGRSAALSSSWRRPRRRAARRPDAAATCSTRCCRAPTPPSARWRYGEFCGTCSRCPRSALVTTHDLELAACEELAAASVAVHFTEAVEHHEDGLRLDVRLPPEPRVATSRNALKLLGIVGLRREDQITTPDSLARLASDRQNGSSGRRRKSVRASGVVPAPGCQTFGPAAPANFPKFETIAMAPRLHPTKRHGSPLVSRLPADGGPQALGVSGEPDFFPTPRASRRQSTMNSRAPPAVRDRCGIVSSATW